MKDIDLETKRRLVFKELTGEDPEDVLGNDWMNTFEEYLDGEGLTHEGHRVGDCFVCRDGI